MNTRATSDSRLQETLDRLCRDISEIKESQKGLDRSFKDKISKLEKLLEAKDKKIHELENRIDDLEQYSRKEDIIVSGLKIVRPYAEVVEGEAQDPRQEKRNFTESQTLDTLNQHGMEITENEISACHVIGKRKDDGSQSVIIRFVSRKSKMRVMARGKNLKNTGIYVNEHLTKKNGEIAKKARDLKRAKKVMDTWVRDTKIFVKDKEGKVMIVKQLSDLQNF